MEKVEITKISHEVKEFVDHEGVPTIRSANDLDGALEILKKVVVKKKEIEAKRVQFVKPLNDQVSFINAEFKAMAKPLEVYEVTIRGRIGDWRTKEAARIDEKNRKDREKQQEAFDKEQARLLAEAKAVKSPEAKKELIADIKRAEFTPAVKFEQQTTVRSENAKIVAKKVWKMQVLDEGDVPREYCSVDQAKVRDAIRKGITTIPGIKIWQEESLNLF